MSNIILCGFKSCGKTTLGKKLAERLDRHFIDTDDLIASNCRSLYREEGVEAFRALEKKVIEALAEFQSCVIATGGGSLLDPENVALFKRIGRIFYLRVDKEELKRRILEDELPAFLDPDMPEASFEAMYQSRVGIFESIADEIIENEDQFEELIMRYSFLG